MPNPFHTIRDFDRLVHDPSRLVILTALDACGTASFMFLRSLTGLSRGNLSLHLGKLLANELVSFERKDQPRRTVTWVRLTRKGRKAIRDHWRCLEEIPREVSKWTAWFRDADPAD